ncbi:hypothetical protein C0J52_19032 [Blattella germanica]|nr:hypothetical protein C0J52_19032 [Blattella germanica]
MVANGRSGGSGCRCLQQWALGPALIVRGKVPGAPAVRDWGGMETADHPSPAVTSTQSVHAGAEGGRSDAVVRQGELASTI